MTTARKTRERNGYDDETPHYSSRKFGTEAKLLSMFDYSPEELAWREEALCNDPEIHSDIFFPERGCSILDAYTICRACPVRMECLEFALSSHKDDEGGVRGGFTPYERREIRKEVRRGIPLAKAAKPWDQKRERKLAKAKVRIRLVMD